MRENITALILFLSALTTYAQNTNKADLDIVNSPQQEEKKISLIMRNDTVWKREGSTETALKNEITIGGTTVKPGGRVRLRSGTVLDLKEGDVVLSDGKILTASKKE